MKNDLTEIKELLSKVPTTQLQGIKNFTMNIEPTMFKMRQAINDGKSVKLTLSEQNNLMQYYLEVRDYIFKQS